LPLSVVIFGVDCVHVVYGHGGEAVRNAFVGARASSGGSRSPSSARAAQAVPGIADDN